MSQSLTKLLVHLVFSTKDREAFLRDDIRPELHKYMAGVLNTLGSPAVLIQSVADHVHILFALSKNEPLVRIVEDVKKHSSRWIKTKGIPYRAFHWQRGYGAFSVSESQCKAVERYIADQEEHHRTKTFQDELRGFLRKSRVAYDERHVWD